MNHGPKNEEKWIFLSEKKRIIRQYFNFDFLYEAELSQAFFLSQIREIEIGFPTLCVKYSQFWAKMNPNHTWKPRVQKWSPIYPAISTLIPYQYCTTKFEKNDHWGFNTIVRSSNEKIWILLFLFIQTLCNIVIQL